MSDTEQPDVSPSSEEPTPRTRRSRRPKRGRFGVGSCLSQTFSIWSRNFIPFTVLSAIVMSPYIAWLFLFPEHLVAPDLSWEDAVDYIFPTFLGYILSSTIVYGAYQQLRGQPAPMGDSIARGLSALPRVIGVSLLIGLLVIALMGPAFLVMSVSEDLGGLMHFVSSILMMILFMGLAPAIPVCIFEDKSGPGVLKRSWSLTSGYKWPIFLFMLVLGLLQGLLGAVLGGCLGLSLADDAERVARMGVILGVVLQVLFSSMQSVSSTVIYHDLRRTKEGIDTEELASIFD